MPLGMEVGLGLGDFVLDVDAALPPQKGGEAPYFRPCLLWPNGWIDQDGTWHGGGPRSRPHCARWGASIPPPKRGQSPPIFGPFLLWQKGRKMVVVLSFYCGKRLDASGYHLVRRRHCVRWGPSSSLPKVVRPVNFRPMSVVAKRLDGLRCHLVWR